MASIFKCPNCGARPNRHGEGGSDACEEEPGCKRCSGFICECDGTRDPRVNKKDHGESEDNPCEQATCYHCGWGGTFPVPTFDPGKLRGWAKTAWSEGWRPPKGWTPSKKRTITPT
jgi:hypothetical protein